MLQRTDQIGRSVTPHELAFDVLLLYEKLPPTHPCHPGLPTARALRGFNELQRCELLDQLQIHRQCIDVEPWRARVIRHRAERNLPAATCPPTMASRSRLPCCIERRFLRIQSAERIGNALHTYTPA